MEVSFCTLNVAYNARVREEHVCGNFNWELWKVSKDAFEFVDLLSTKFHIFALSKIFRELFNDNGKITKALNIAVHALLFKACECSFNVLLDLISILDAAFNTGELLFTKESI